MKVTVKRIGAFLLALLLLLSVVACAKEELPTTPTDTKKKVIVTNPTEEEETEPPVPIDFWVDLVKGGKAMYTIISEHSDYDKIAKSLAESLTQKTGVTFSVGTNKNANGRKIFVGTDPDSVLSNFDDLTYNGQVVLYSNSHIYIMGFVEVGVQRAAERFQSNILDEYVQTDENGDVEVKIPNTAFFFYNPTNYSNTSPMVLNSSLAEYHIVFPQEMTQTELFLARAVIDTLGSATGLKLKYVTDATAPSDKEIVFGLTNRPQSQTLTQGLGEGEYAIKSIEKRIYVVYDTMLVSSDARDKLCSMVAANITQAVDIRETPDYTPYAVKKKDPSHIRVMTSNIVCAGDLNGVETFLDGMGITWEERVGLQADMIMDYLPDFIGLQEMQEAPNVNGYDGYMHTVMKEGTAGEYSFVEYEGLAAHNYWTPIMYRSTVWQVEDKDYGTPFDHGSMHRWQWALFSRIDNPEERYILINLHNPTSKNLEEQQAAAEEVNSLFFDLEFMYPDAPIFITGDFNASITSTTLKKTIFGTDLETSYQLTEDDGNQRHEGSIDLVLVQKNKVNVEACRIVYTHRMEMTSDHRPYFADVSLKTE